jgi:hypothetical protein
MAMKTEHFTSRRKKFPGHLLSMSQKINQELKNKMGTFPVRSYFNNPQRLRRKEADAPLSPFTFHPFPTPF